MLRTTIPRSCMTRIRTPQFCQSFVTVRPNWSEGDTGSIRAGGVAASDSFNRREQVLENMYFKQHEIENIRKMREKLLAQRKHLDEVESHLNEMEAAAIKKAADQKL
ncbi:hypothetical protein AYO21_05829 [Fonsecaea monophora]|uniref:ATPase inhibitor, mitochondrial n=3 Tax=Fonsecaea TaxID=40354 RepID=A0A0D2FG05_9EURO|nr:uncharacterized protein Z517_01039 [Fonsecaea pedrosoi CBS 271.37]XP_022498466.1 hypothetical protein AYO20_07310 [Fonsecaea nubica]XP_022511908.1 hypothetical protein AYO21_05829 [Fonsecaea monophora]KAH0844837.1 ATPase inhibitor, mitochondrial [Fonsecaea pedrosoi]KIW85647.1 hypothetical protein Z517_01039 [Fonsecaea pedrosoi CBS 271.37]OAG39956.1 hypothetical protein AYO21_05829 [Fonsecaea monophora]OAL33454.1 hypothetical protein AYO20_07310 [Fonsecaea nubica]